MSNMTMDTLHLSLFTNKDAEIQKDFKVFAQEEVTFLSESFQFRVIGESHFISCDALAYHEIFSSVSGYTEEVVEFNLDTVSTHTTPVFSLGKYSVTIEVSVVEDSVDDPSTTPYILYTFPNGAYTSITIGETFYTTMHKYPEYNKVVHTKTTFSTV